MNNAEFLNVLKQSYKEYLRSHRRSNEKLKILHGKIADDLQGRLGKEYEVKALGFGNEQEAVIIGRYINKKVDITVVKNGFQIAGIAVKFIMTNYAQNSNNYFESMLGETANIRSANKKYFQVIILPEELPYFDKEDIITKTEHITRHNLDKYIKLATDNTQLFFHTPNKTLLYVIKTTADDFTTGQSRTEWLKYMLTNLDIIPSAQPNPFNGDGTIYYNDYDSFIEKVKHGIMEI
jgi:hypothetical protein